MGFVSSHSGILQLGNKLTPTMMKIDDTGPTGEWQRDYITNFDEKIVSHLNLDRSTKILGKDPARYTLYDGFLEQDRYWIRDINTSRMTADSTVLYRPGIVNALLKSVKYLLTRKTKEGMMIKGPQGVGKSYTLVNLTRYLLASKEYVVTIIPDCEHWGDMDYLFRCILHSVGVDASSLTYSSADAASIKQLIRDIDKILAQRGRKWVFIFDQINKLFARTEFRRIQNVGMLPFPFRLIKEIMEPGRIISIISASANNDASHRENHGGFLDFIHQNHFEKREMQMLYTDKKVSSWSMPELEYATGRVPWYLNRWVVGVNAQYASEVRSEINSSLHKLKREKKDEWEFFTSSSLQYLLQARISDAPSHYDRKYLLLKPERGSYVFIPLFPLVEEAYRKFFWDELLKHIGEHEAKLLQICAHEKTTDDVRGRLFEQMVISRLSQSGLSANDVTKILDAANITMTSDMRAALECPFILDLLQGMAYPSFAPSNACTLYIPLSPNFPAVDLIFRLGKVVIAFQIHVSEKHTNVLPALQLHAKNAEWKKGGIHTIILLYLVPVDRLENNSKTAKSLKRKRQQQPETSTDSIQYYGCKYVTLHNSLHDFEPLQNMKWPV